jgi:starch synthase (maltosyl-transferring)
MKAETGVTQSPTPGESKVMYCGDSAVFKLTLSIQIQGRAFVRTNLGFANTARMEIIKRVEKGEIKLDEAWYDIEMEPESDLVFKIVLPLHETGFFQAKCFFIPDNHTTPVWPEGDNCIINVEPAGTICGNIIYNAFVRQFTSAKSSKASEDDFSASIKQLDEKGYTVIPESGKFRDLKNQIEFIFSELGCRILHLLPIHPTPTTYARMGRFGSPYAALNFTDVDPALAQFDPSATPMEQFMELVDMVHFYSGYLFMDIAINHTGWAASIHETNPEWLVRDDEGEIQAPGAWGVVWADLTRLDYSNSKLWEYMADVFLLWCHRGVDGFRCDAGYMIPVPAWEYIVAKVRVQYPETLFFLEGLGGPIKTTCDILGKANFNWAYSELFQNYSRDEISNYLPKTYDISNRYGATIHFAETHDNNRLAAVSKIYAKMRTALCALFSVSGGFGFANGVEWFATQKIDVHESSCLNWGDKNNQVEHITKLNQILKNHPCFLGATRLDLIQNSHCEGLVLLRYNEFEDKKLLILINLDCENSNEVSWSRQTGNINKITLYDLLARKEVTIKTESDSCRVQLKPGETMALTPDFDDIKLIAQKSRAKNNLPPKVYLQKLKAKVLLIHTILKGYGNLKNRNIDQEAISFARDPVEFIRSFNKDSKESRVIVFDVQKDMKRQVMIPPGFFLLIKSNAGFRAQIIDQNIDQGIDKQNSSKKTIGYEEGILTYDGKESFTLFSPSAFFSQGTVEQNHKEYILNIRMFKYNGSKSDGATSNGDEFVETVIQKASLLCLAPFKNLDMNFSFTREEIVKVPFLKLIAATNRGGMMRAAAWWGNVDSKYDAFLGANMDRSGPENRWMVFSRCRIWSIFQGYSRELVPDCLEKFTFSYHNGGRWLFHIPTSEGKYYALKLYLTLDPENNHVCLKIERGSADIDNDLILEDNKAVTIIMRPDVEDRSFHEPVKAFKGPEKQWPEAVKVVEDGFSFLLSNSKKLEVNISKGDFVHEPEWHYMVHHILEESRGLDADSDLFSPGYFTVPCLGKEKIILNAAVLENQREQLNHGGKIDFKEQNKFHQPELFENSTPLFKAVEQSLDAFIVDRGDDKSVIAGYPWFLDWGRDSLIFCRSLIELDRFSEAKAILRLFGRFEKNGTLPNMICGKDAANIETSDAPLWFVACCKDLVKKEKSTAFLDEMLDNRKVLNILLSIANSLIKGTKTGVKADGETMLLYSPSHFTWMDTNYPAGSPRQGYPIEIQALWYNALDFLVKVDMRGKKSWQKKAKLVQESIFELFYNDKSSFFVDCLHADAGVSAKEAVADDALRPNQLFLFTLDVIEDNTIVQKCVETCQQLIVPGAIRSLADLKVEYPLKIIYNGELLNDPHYPYAGIYRGDEDRQRKPAYHNGTAWTWPFPVFCEAWAKAFGEKSYSTSLAWLGSVLPLMRHGAAGYIPEILDGDYPHTSRGCDAQAWGSSEFVRVMHKLL